MSNRIKKILDSKKYQTQARIQSMYKFIDSLSNQYSLEKNTQKREDVYIKILEAESTLKKIEDNFNLEVVNQFFTLTKPKVYDYIFDSSKSEILYFPEKNFLENNNPQKTINIGHVNYTHVFENVLKIQSDLEEWDALMDKWYNSENYDQKELYWQQQKDLRKKILARINAIIIDVARRNDIDYVITSIDEKFDFYPINGYNFFNDIQSQYKN